MKFKVRISLGANNSLGPAKPEYYLDPCGRCTLHGSEIYMIGVGIRSDHVLGSQKKNVILL
jgi:hypothetical protein